MRAPTKDMLLRHARGVSFALSLHPNPKLYKHSWQIFTKESCWEGEEFLRHAPRLSTAMCMQRLTELDLRGEPYILYGSKQPRRFAGMPFDQSSARWRDAKWAPALEKDPDHEWNGHR